MAAIRATGSFAATVADAERCWYDTARWPRWVDGLDEVTAVSEPWPEAGAAVHWVSGPAGRGEVTERVIAREALRGQTLAVSDASLEGKQSVRFSPDGACVEVTLTLDYRLRRQSPLMAVVDRLFIRRPMQASLQATVSRFGVELAATTVPPP
ncbi:MAG: SRPBCC family protein [Actinomycetota bacterium]|nr:SRPBCC family protein [Actinomycetota bacterium]